MKTPLVLAILSLAATLAAQEPSPLQTFLERPILAPETTLKEVQKFAESRIPRVPEAKSAEEWTGIANKLREDALTKIVFRGGAAAWRTAQTQVEWLETIPGGPGYKIKRLRYEALPGFWIPAVLYEPENLTGKVPVFMNVNGHDGNGKAADYKQLRCINMAKRGIVVLNPEWIGMGQLNTAGYSHSKMNLLDLCGASGLAPFYLGMSRGLDLLLALPNADPARVGVSGLSGGGWQTIIISSLDTRVTLSNPVAGYSSFRTRAIYASDLGDSEQTPTDLATVTDYTHLTAMLAPRTALLTYNSKDNCCFASAHALPPLMQAASPVYDLFQAGQKLRFHVNSDPGDHNFLEDNRQALYRAIGDAFYPDDAAFKREEIPSKEEVKTLADLTVPLPEGNLDFHLLAKRAMESLPKPSGGDRRAKLREIVHYRDYTVAAEEIAQDKAGDTTAIFYKLKQGEWTVPAVELTRGEPKGTTLLFGEKGRKALPAEIEKLLSEGQRVLAVDPFYFGESAFASRDYLYALLVATVGERALGIQTSQLNATARWIAAKHGGQKIAIQGVGARAGVVAQIAAAMEPGAIASAQSVGGMASLKQIVTEGWVVQQAPELICFGLLEEFDVPQIVELIGK